MNVDAIRSRRNGRGRSELAAAFGTRCVQRIALALGRGYIHQVLRRNTCAGRAGATIRDNGMALKRTRRAEEACEEVLTRAAAGAARLVRFHVR